MPIVTAIDHKFHQKQRHTFSYSYNICRRCGGGGYLPQYSHIANGICFSCHGDGEYQGCYTSSVLPTTPLISHSRYWCIILDTTDKIIASFTLDHDCNPEFHIQNRLEDTKLSRDNVRVIFGEKNEALSSLKTRIKLKQF
ncbi:hypothetical protein [Shewanella phaeophyticola]|uniref:Uncharacterized protein n=1 Tax=Shewanella phaeophyticola TaxID=2978345 RepID=A0ABT2P6M0_9GAMM|nr:hypothetical protein [Shewanella sp. KJ10-1]MCT8988306.1 hypothetical protein [Shewanella sp. KJ10-1]